MPRAQTNKYETAAAPQGCGCFILPPFVVILLGSLLGILAFQLPAVPQSPDSSSIAAFFTPEIHYWEADITRWANASSLDPNLIATIMQIESCGDPLATSSAGAMGLFQVMPFHFAAFENPFNPETNATRGLDYLSRALNASNGDARLAMAGYNGGIGVISRAEWSWPDETKRYIRYGVPIYEDARQGLEQSPTLFDWYKNYGEWLCKRASEHQR